MTEELKQKVEDWINAEELSDYVGMPKNSLIILMTQFSAEIVKEATKELQEVIEKNEYYQNGYRAGSHDEMVKYETKLFEAEGKVEIRDMRITDLRKQIEKMKNQWNCKNNNGHCVSSICPCKDKWELKE